MANELQKISDYYDRRTALDMEYRDYMEKQVAVGTNINNSLDKVQGSIAQMHTGIQNSINAQTFAIVASQAALAQTFNQGFYQVSNQLGSMTASFSMGFARVENALDKMSDIMNNPLLTQSRELYRRAADRSKKGQFEEALEDTKAALEKDKTDYTAWFLQGKIYSFGASKYSNVIDLDKSIDALTKAAKYNEPNISDSADARKRSAEIYFYLGIAQNAKSNDLIRENKKTESSEMLKKARSSFEQSYQYSNDMLESLFNIARCKVIQGEANSAIRDLETLMLRDRSYCIKVCADNDFSSIGEQFTNLINKLKNRAFIPAKNDYDRINAMLAELKSLSGRTGENIPSSFTEALPYFDILDYAKDFTRIIPIVANAIAERKAAIAKAEQEAREAEAARAKAVQDAINAEEWRRKQEQSRKWVESGRCGDCGGSLSFFTSGYNHKAPWSNDERKCSSCGNSSQNPYKSKRISTMFVVGEVIVAVLSAYILNAFSFPYSSAIIRTIFILIPFYILFFVNRLQHWGFKKFIRVTSVITQIIVSISMFFAKGLPYGSPEIMVSSFLLLVACFMAYKIPLKIYDGYSYDG